MIDIIFEDNHLLILNKPAGMPVVPDSSGDNSLLQWGKAYIKESKNKPGNVFLAVVHRIDRPVSGVVCFAKTSKAAARLSQQVRDRTIKKGYLAVVEGKLHVLQGEIDNYLKKDRKLNKVFVASPGAKGAKRAITKWTVVAEKGKRCLVYLEPLTGRSHQLRVHMAKILKAPIIGDVKYGSKLRVLEGKGLALHARHLELIHPTKKDRLNLSAPIPQYYPFSDFKDADKFYDVLQ